MNRGRAARVVPGPCAALVDAVEINGMYAPGANFNVGAGRWAARHGKPVVGNCDVHRLSQLGTTYSLVAAHADADSICEAIRAGRVEVRTEPLTWLHTATLLGDLFSAAARAAAVRLCSGIRASRSAART